MTLKPDKIFKFGIQLPKKKINENKNSSEIGKQATRVPNYHQIKQKGKFFTSELSKYFKMHIILTFKAYVLCTIFHFYKHE